MICFEKYSGCGNDFIVIDNRKNVFKPSQDDIFRLCHRRFGIGADGVILLENSTSADYLMRIFNADGSEAEMCGNGIRCLARFIQNIEKVESAEWVIQTMHQCISLKVNHDLVSVMMPPVGLFRSHININIDGLSFLFHFIDTSVPHVVHFTDDIDNPNLMRCAPQIRFHSEFSPKGTNVNFAKILSDSSIAVRTYERGVEGETLACGTGAVAVALVAAKLYSMKEKVVIWPLSQEALTITFNDSFEDISMIGPANKIFEGTFRPDT